MIEAGSEFQPLAAIEIDRVKDQEITRISIYSQFDLEGNEAIRGLRANETKGNYSFRKKNRYILVSYQYLIIYFILQMKITFCRLINLKNIIKY